MAERTERDERLILDALDWLVRKRISGEPLSDDDTLLARSIDAVVQERSAPLRIDYVAVIRETPDGDLFKNPQAIPPSPQTRPDRTIEGTLVRFDAPDAEGIALGVIPLPNVNPEGKPPVDIADDGTTTFYHPVYGRIRRRGQFADEVE